MHDGKRIDTFSTLEVQLFDAMISPENAMGYIMTLEDAINAVYDSMTDDNQDIDMHIKNLKNTLKENSLKEAIFDPARLVQNNREGRKRMQSYFKKRGVKVTFKKD